MKAISVSELKINPSRYLRLVQRGGEVQILVRGKPVARLVGLANAPQGQRRERLVRAGVLRPGKGRLKKWLTAHPALRLPGADLSGALQEERGDRV